MTLALLLSFLVILTLSNGAAVKSLSPRIINGKDAKLGEFPYQISLQEKRSHFHLCGGSILNEKYVLTAAHCIVDQQADLLEVVSGTIYLKERHSVHNVVKIIVHAKYDPFNFSVNDIALLKVQNPFVNSQHTSFVTLPKPEEEINANAAAVVSGWGRLEQDGETPNTLQRATIRILEQKVCRNKFKRASYKIYESQICAYDPKVEKSACYGDSGGPLTVNGKIVGIVSWSLNCSTTGFPAVYTRVSFYLDWIAKHAV